MAAVRREGEPVNAVIRYSPRSNGICLLVPRIHRLVDVQWSVLVLSSIRFVHTETVLLWHKCGVLSLLVINN